jgi:hypothetical protein
MTEVSNGDLLGVLLKVENRIGMIDGTLLSVKEQLQNDRLRATAIDIAHTSKQEKIEGRIQKLEQWRWTQTGAAGMIGAALTAIFSNSWRWPFSGQ